MMRILVMANDQVVAQEVAWQNKQAAPKPTLHADSDKEEEDGESASLLLEQSKEEDEENDDGDDGEEGVLEEAEVFPGLLELRRCRGQPALQGPYRRTRAFEGHYAEQQQKRHPVYEQWSREEEGGSKEQKKHQPRDKEGTGERTEVGTEQHAPHRILCYWWRFSKVSSGWWLGPAVGRQEGLLGHCPRSAPKLL